jgi:hypothetical protein
MLSNLILNDEIVKKTINKNKLAREKEQKK